MSSRHAVIPAVYILFKQKEKILFLRRYNTGYADGMLTPVAGHVEEHEHYSVAAVREAAEEVSLIITVDQLKIFHVMHRVFSDQSDRLDVFFLVEKWDGLPINNEPQKCSELVWCDYKNLPDDILPFVARALELGFAGILFSEC